MEGAQLKRPATSPAAQEGWTTVTSRKRRKRQLPEGSQPLRSEGGMGGDAFLVSANHHFPTPCSAVRALEECYPDIKIRAVLNYRGQFQLYPKDVESRELLSTLKEIQGKEVAILPFKATRKPVKAVVMKYPLELDTDLLLRKEFITSAQRCLSKDKQPTRQVIITCVGKAPTSVDLGIWGGFNIRPYVPDPVRCYRCQRWGHFSSRCKNQERCGVCSGAHPSRVCLDKHHRCETTQAKCPNCGNGHHAWNLRCPERLKRLPRQPMKQKVVQTVVPKETAPA